MPEKAPHYQSNLDQEEYLPETETQLQIEKKLRVSELLKVWKNPTLHLEEKIYAVMAFRKAEVVQLADGTRRFKDEELHQKALHFITGYNGKKLDFDFLVRRINKAELR